jgi:hypothetical protein
MSYMLAAIPIPDTDDTLDPVPTADGFGYAAGITRRRRSNGAIV